MAFQTFSMEVELILLLPSAYKVALWLANSSNTGVTNKRSMKGPHASTVQVSFPGFAPFLQMPSDLDHWAVNWDSFELGIGRARGVLG
jgi:hypothetical protein